MSAPVVPNLISNGKFEPYNSFLSNAYSNNNKKSYDVDINSINFGKK